ncbi:MAG: WG repeat-containing protein [Candidatus Sericytochromatia bacterium]
MKKKFIKLLISIFLLTSCQIEQKNNIEPIINKNGKEIKTINNLLVNLKTYSTFEKDGKLGLLDENKKEILEPLYKTIESIKNKYIKAKINEKWFLFDSNGKKIIEENVDYLDTFEKKGKLFFIFRNNDKYAIFDESTKKITGYIYEYINEHNTNENFILLKKDGKWGLLDLDLKEVIPNKYDDLSSFKNNTFIAKLNNQNTLIDVDIQKVISNSYKNIESYEFGFGLFKVTNEINGKNIYGLIDENGKEILKTKYNEIINIDSYGIVAKIDDKKELFDKNIKNVENIIYPFTDTINYVIGKDYQKTGLITKYGEKIADTKYDNFSFLDNDGEDFIFINIGGEKVIEYATNFSSKNREHIYGGLNGVINIGGKIILEPIYDRIRNHGNYFFAETNNFKNTIVFDENGTKIFESDLFLNYILNDSYIISSKRKSTTDCCEYLYGIIDLKGNSIIDTKYDSINLIDNYFYAKLDKKIYIIDPKDRKILNNNDPTYSTFEKIDYGDVSIVSLGNKYGMINVKGEVITPLKYDSLKIFELDRDYLIGKIDNKMGLLDKKGNVIIEPKYENILPLNYREKLFLVEIDNKYGVIDLKGNIIIEPKYDAIKSTIYDNFIEVTIDKKKGIFDLDGNKITDVKYDKIYESHYPFSDKKFFIILNEKYGVFDSKNKIELSPKYDQLLLMRESEDKYLFRENEKYGIIDINGKILLNAKYESYIEYFDDLYCLSIDKQYIFFDKNFKEVFRSEYKPFESDINKNYRIVEKDGKLGVLDKKGNIIVKIKYRFVKMIENGYFKVILDGSLGTVDEKGNENFIDKVYLEEDRVNYVLLNYQ